MTYKELFEEWLEQEKGKGLLGIHISFQPHILSREYRQKEGIVVTEEEVFMEIVEMFTAPDVSCLGFV